MPPYSGLESQNYSRGSFYGREIVTTLATPSARSLVSSLSADQSTLFAFDNNNTANNVHHSSAPALLATVPSQDSSFSSPEQALVPYYRPAEQQQQLRHNFAQPPHRVNSYDVAMDPPHDQLSPRSVVSSNRRRSTSWASSTLSPPVWNNNNNNSLSSPPVGMPTTPDDHHHPFLALSSSSKKMKKAKVISDAVIPTKYAMKKQRKVRTAAATVGGALVGGLALGPVGAVAGAVGSGYATRKLCQQGERRAQRKFEQENVQKQAWASRLSERAEFC